MKTIILFTFLFVFASCKSNYRINSVKLYITNWLDNGASLGKDFCDNRLLKGNEYCKEGVGFKFAKDYFGNALQEFERNYKILSVHEYLVHDELNNSTDKIILAIISNAVKDGRNSKIMKMEFDVVNDDVFLKDIKFEF